MTVLADKQILEGMKNKTVIIDPFELDSLSTSSYDLRLGEFYYREQPPARGTMDQMAVWPTRIDYYNIYNEDHTKKVWGQPHKAIPVREINYPFFDYENISNKEKVIMLGPGENLLCHTEEFIGGIDPNTTMMKARSSIGRALINVCQCAGWGDVGFFNRWTMEVFNRSQYYTIPLVVGRRIAQLVFLETGGILDKPYGPESGNKYQDSQELEKVKANWKPEMLLPQLHRDRDIRRAEEIA
jgi:dCTP deaminase